MDTYQINGVEIPLLEPPQHKDNDAPRWILYVLFKHKQFILSVLLVVGLLVLFISLLRPTDYIAIAKVMIKETPVLNPTPTSEGGSFRIYASPEIINSEIQILKSRELLERLYKEVPFAKNDPRNVSRGPLEATPIRLTNLIQISQKSSNPEWAAAVVNRAAELYLDQHLKVYKTRGVEEFYDEQEKRLQMELTQAENELKEYQQKEKIVDAGQELASKLVTLAAFETNLRNTESAIRETNERIRILEKQLREQRENVSAGKSIADNPVYTRINERIVQLQLERNNLLQRYTEKDRLVMDKDKEITELKNRLSAQVQKMVEGESVSLNSLHQGILSSFLAARAELNSLEARRSSLLKDVASYSAAAAELKKKSFLYDRLQQNVNARKEALSLYKRKGEEAKISDAMDERKFSNVSIFEKARLPLPTAGWRLWMTILVTLLTSIAIAVAGAFTIEFLNTTLRNEADVEEQIGLPVLATIQHYHIIGVKGA